MKRVCLAMAFALGAAAAAWARPAPLQIPVEHIHPAVVRIVAQENGGTTYGSGALVAISGDYGLVMTNWHVICDATGPILVIFPNGFRSGAKVVKADRAWDLAALSIWRPNVEPIPLATEAPRPGELLTIAGYGSGWYRTASGQVIQYVSPGWNHPAEMVELAAPARQGDSGGPILNQRGELAGVLFGTAFGRTTGSYCGRVRDFLGPVCSEFKRSPPAAPLPRTPDLPGEPSLVAQAPPAREPREELVESRPLPPTVVAIAPRPTQQPTAGQPSRPDGLTSPDWRSAPQRPPVATAAPAQPVRPLGWQDIAGATWGAQLKTVLAAIGFLAAIFHGLRLLATK